MTTFVITRHLATIEWMQRRGIRFDRAEPSLSLDAIHAGDIVIGNLPVDLAEIVCGYGARYLHLVVPTPLEMRGKELSASDLDALRAHLKEFHVVAL